MLIDFLRYRAYYTFSVCRFPHSISHFILLVASSGVEGLDIRAAPHRTQKDKHARKGCLLQLKTITEELKKKLNPS